MRTQVIETRPTRENWGQFCEEPELTPGEWAAWYRLAPVALVNDEVAKFIEAEAATEIAEDRQFGFPADWSDLAQSSDAFRRMRRAQIAAWRKWQAQEASIKEEF